MKYIKEYKIFESIDDELCIPGGIPKWVVEEIFQEVWYYIDHVEFWIDDAESSAIVEPDNENIFVIFFENMKNNISTWSGKEYLYAFENYLIKNKKLVELENHLNDYGLEISVADFGNNDWEYEIVICRKGTKVIRCPKNLAKPTLTLRGYR